MATINIIMKHQSILITAAILAVLTLSACGQQQSKITDNSVKSAQSSKKQAKKKATAKKSATPKDNTEMNFAQIQKGNFSSLTGNWTELLEGLNRQNGTRLSLTAGSGQQLNLTASTIKTADMQITGTKLTDNTGAHQLTYTNKNGVLSATLADADSVAINWGVTFYPKNTTSQYGYMAGTKANDQNLLVVLTSNNSFTQVFAQNVTAAQKNAVQSMNLTQVDQENFTSLVGTWKNPTSGKTIVVSSSVQKNTSSTYQDVTQGAVISGNDVNGQHEVLMKGELSAGTMVATLGYFSDAVPGTNVTPVTLAPKGTKIEANDDSDQTKDRMILGSGQGGFASEAYYRVQ
jgi:hypothetical protein